MNLSDSLLLLATLVSGGGLAELLRAIRESRKAGQEADRAGVDMDLAIQAQRSAEEQRILDGYMRVNEALQSRLTATEGERDYYRERLATAEVELQEIRVRVDQLQVRIHALLDGHDNEYPPE